MTDEKTNEDDEKDEKEESKSEGKFTWKESDIEIVESKKSE
jgi:hypothetical protein